MGYFARRRQKRDVARRLQEAELRNRRAVASADAAANTAEKTVLANIAEYETAATVAKQAISHLLEADPSDACRDLRRRLDHLVACGPAYAAAATGDWKHASALASEVVATRGRGPVVDALQRHCDDERRWVVDAGDSLLTVFSRRLGIRRDTLDDPTFLDSHRADRCDALCQDESSHSPVSITQDRKQLAWRSGAYDQAYEVLLDRSVQLRRVNRGVFPELQNHADAPACLGCLSEDRSFWATAATACELAGDFAQMLACLEYAVPNTKDWGQIDIYRRIATLALAAPCPRSGPRKAIRPRRSVSGRPSEPRQPADRQDHDGRTGAVPSGDPHLQVMQVLWRAGECTADKVRSALSDGPWSSDRMQLVLKDLIHRGAVVGRGRHRFDIVYRAAVGEVDYPLPVKRPGRLEQEQAMLADEETKRDERRKMREAALRAWDFE